MSQLFDLACLRDALVNVGAFAPSHGPQTGTLRRVMNNVNRVGINDGQGRDGKWRDGK